HEVRPYDIDRGRTRGPPLRHRLRADTRSAYDIDRGRTRGPPLRHQPRAARTSTDRNAHSMKTPTQDTPATGFDALGLTPRLVANGAALGYEEAAPIQREAIPALVTGRDLAGQAGTGTGKPAAFALPMVNRLATTEAGTTGPRGLILVPTRELAMQVSEAVHKYSKGMNLSVVPLYGGASMEQQIRALRRGAGIIVATPGRALDHLRRRTLDLSGLEMLVLDEADEMLDMGFAEDLDAILESTPETRQTALFAATMAPRIAAVAARHLDNPMRVPIAQEQ